MTHNDPTFKNSYSLPGLSDLEQSRYSERKLRRLFEDTADSIKHYYLGSLYPGIYFTPQEARCMFYFLQHFTNAQVAKCLNLSDRTVGSYAGNMQRKLRLKNKKKMIEVVKETDFLKYFFENRPLSLHSVVSSEEGLCVP